MRRIVEFEAEINTLLNTHINSVEKLEFVMALLKEPTRQTSIMDVVREAQLPPPVARRVGGDLQKTGLIQLTPRGIVQLTPKNRLERTAVDELATLSSSTTGRAALVAALSLA